MRSLQALIGFPRDNNNQLKSELMGSLKRNSSLSILAAESSFGLPSDGRKGVLVSLRLTILYALKIPEFIAASDFEVALAGAAIYL